MLATRATASPAATTTTKITTEAATPTAAKIAMTTKTTKTANNKTMASSANMLLTKISDTAATKAKTTKSIKTTTISTAKTEDATTIALRAASGTTLSYAAAAGTTKATTTTLTGATTASTTKTITATIVAPATITSDPGILCFHHCNVKVFCFHLPHRCPKCKQVLDTGDEVGGSSIGSGNGSSEGDDDEGGDSDVNGDADDSHCTNEMGSTKDDRRRVGGGGGVGGVAGGISSTRLLPFRLPYPFIRASQYPCAIVLRPTTGDFLNDYNNSTDLHIAVTTSTGCVVEFDRHGLRRHRADNNTNTRMSDWWQCLLVGDVPEPWYDYWDEILQQICNQPDRWTIAHYQEDSHNCYTFVLAFLQALGYDKLSAAANSKTTFCEKYIVPRTTTAGKYISLYRKLRDTGIYVHPHHHHHHHHHQHQRHSLLKQQQQQKQQHQFQVQHVKQPRGKSRINGHFNGGGSASALLANGSKTNGIILRAPNLCTIEE